MIDAIKRTFWGGRLWEHFRPGLCGVLIGLCSIFAAGCESDDERRSLGRGFDFGNNSPNVVLAVGDSITTGNGDIPYTYFLEPMIGKRIHNRGVNGARSDQGATRIQGLLSTYNPGFTIIMYGANDINQGRSPSTIVANLRTMVVACRDANSLPILCTITPQTNERVGAQGAVNHLNSEIRRLASTENVTLADVAAFFGSGDGAMSEDNLHPNLIGARVIARSIAVVF